MNKLSRGILVELHNKYQCSMPCGVRQEDSYSERVSSQAGSLNSPCAPNRIKLVEAYQVVLHTKYVQGIVISDKKNWLVFPI